MKPAINRRTALGGLIAGSSLLPGQQDPFHDHSRVPAIDELRTVTEFEAVAFAKVPREVYTYTAYGAEGEFTLRRNRQAFDWVELVPRAVVDVSAVETSLNILGTPMDFPIFVSPSSVHAELHPDGEAATHRGATAARTPMMVSYNASLSKEKIAAAAEGPLWFQLYPLRDLGETKEWIDDAQEHGARAVILTLDQQASYYERAIHDRHLDAPPGGGLAARLTAQRRARAGVSSRPGNPYRVPDGRLWYDWKYVDQVKRMLKVPLVAKGVLTGEDAKTCLDHGVNAVYVSNHGGRSLDYGPSTLEVLMEIADAIQGRAPILIDSGFRSGVDILKALALGATAACIGRGIRWGLAAYGAPGVQRALEILQAELIQAMAAMGRPTLKSVDRSLVKTNLA